jgi:isopenicillin N synthase-like dioxygenase
VDLTLAANVKQQAKDFFALPLERKMGVCTDLLPDEYCGYHPMERNNPNGFKKRGSSVFEVPGDLLMDMPTDLYEAFNWNYNAANDPDHPDPAIPEVNLWPSELPAFKSTLLAYQAEMIKFARKLTQIFALALHLDEHAFDSAVVRPEAGARILRYPAQDASRNEQQGIGAHTDVEHFTIITSETEGLEVLSKTGRWIKVEPVAGSFVLNIADCFMRQTNDFFVSTVHRVINETGQERYSVPFFWGLDRRTVLEPIEGCVTEELKNKYEVMTAGEYYLWRTRRQKVAWRVGDAVSGETV